MNFKMMGRFIAQILSIEGVFMLPALAISLYCRETAAAWGFFYTLLVIVFLALALKLLYELCHIVYVPVFLLLTC